MNIGVIGTGKMGTALGRRWARAGHQVFFGSRDAAKAQAAAAEVGAGAQGGSYQEAVQFADVLLLAIPWKASREVIESLLPLDGKIIIETTNNFSGSGGDGATTEQIARWAKGARVVKAFNTIFQALITSDPPPSDRPTVCIAGDDDDAKATAAQLVADSGFDPLDVGGLEQAHFLDSLAQFIVYLGYNRGMGTTLSYKITHF